MFEPRLLLVLISLFGAIGIATGADMKVNTAIVCVIEDSQSLTNFGGYDGTDKPDKIRSKFVEWLFSEDNVSRRSNIRFLWTPDSSKGPQLKIFTKDTNHSQVRLLSQTKNTIIATSSASDTLTAVGWVFSINFKLEEVMGSTVKSNLAGLQGKTVKYSCQFDDQILESE